jgi:hypothetical protein
MATPVPPPDAAPTPDADIPTYTSAAPDPHRHHNLAATPPVRHHIRAPHVPAVSALYGRFGSGDGAHVSLVTYNQVRCGSKRG